jgi:hypothetical protein
MWNSQAGWQRISLGIQQENELQEELSGILERIAFQARTLRV